MATGATSATRDAVRHGCGSAVADGAGPRVAIAHEWLVRFAGSERCVAELVEAFPGARILTTLVDEGAIPAALGRAEPSCLQRLPASARTPERLFPLLPLAWRLRRPVMDVDAVISSSHAFAKAVRIAPDIPHVCYCHTPMRYAWRFEIEARRLRPLLRVPARAAAGPLRTWDRRSARGVAHFVANSRAVADRIAGAYGRHAEVVHPPVRTDFFTPGGERSDEFLYVGRLVSYKRADLVVRAFEGLPYRLLVVGRGHLSRELRATATPNVRFVEAVDDDELRELYRAASALVFPAEEDFGIVMAEAQACGTPVIALSAGGARDIVEDGVTGWLIDRQDVDALRAAVRRAADASLDRSSIRSRAERFSTERFREEMRRVVHNVVAGVVA